MRLSSLKNLSLPLLLATATVLVPSALLAQEAAPAKQDIETPQKPQPVRDGLKPAGKDAVAAINAPVQQTGKLVFPQTQYDMGKVREGEKVEVKFAVTNPTDKPIKITSIQTSCGCTSAKDNPTSIGPGETTALKVVYDTANKEGRHARTVTVYTEEEQGNATYALRLEAEAIADVFLSEKNIKFGEVVVGTTAGKRFDLITMTDPPTQVLSVTSADQKLILSKGEPTEYIHSDGRKGQRIPITVEVPADYPVGSINSAISVATSDSMKPNLMASLSGLVVGNYKATPQRVMMGSLRPGTSKDLSVIVKSNSGKPFTVKNVEMADPIARRSTEATKNIPITFQIEDGPEADSKKVTAKFVAPTTEQNYTADIYVTLEMDGQEERLTMPFRAYVRTASDSTQPPSAANVNKVSADGKALLAPQDAAARVKRPSEGPPAPPAPAHPEKKP